MESSLFFVFIKCWNGPNNCSFLELLAVFKDFGSAIENGV